jgi:general stress protein 26
MLVTMTPQGDMRGRAMATQDLDAVHDCDLWFATGDDSPKVEELEADPRACVTACRPSDRAYLSISAEVRRSRDRAEIERLWKPDWKAWFPDGPHDPNITLLKLTVKRAEYWEPKGNKLRVLYDIARAVAAGKPADANLEPIKRI